MHRKAKCRSHRPAKSMLASWTLARCSSLRCARVAKWQRDGSLYTYTMNHLKFNKERIEEAVKKSLSISETMVNLGYKQFAGGSHACLSRNIKRLGIGTSHFLGQRANCGQWRIGGPAQKKTAEETLIYHSNGRRGKTVRLRRAMIEVGKEQKCYVCGIFSWMDKPFNLEIEHLDGEFQNDRKENLEFICPNCHSQTLTFCRNKKSARMVEPKTHCA